jgi:hypothetical protein
LDKLVLSVAAAGRPLNITLIYEDIWTQQWANDICELVKRKAGSQEVRPMWWKLDNLSEPGVLAGAVSTALRADIIIVSTLATEGLPLPFYVWVNAWLGQRRQAPGALVALLGMPERFIASSGRVEGYLRAVANQSRMVLLVKERKFREVSPVNGIGPQASRAFSRLNRLILGHEPVSRLFS